MGKRRTRWAVAEKRIVCGANAGARANVAGVALAEGVNANQIFQWRRAYLQGSLDWQKFDDAASVNNRERPFCWDRTRDGAGRDGGSMFYATLTATASSKAAKAPQP